MEPKPKERIVFDEDSYYGDEGEKMAINDLMERDGLTEDEVREDFTDDEIFNHQMEMKDFDYEEEIRALAAFFNGEKSDMSDFVNPYGGNHILVSGSVGRWNGTSTGIAVYKDFDAATDCSPSSRRPARRSSASCPVRTLAAIPFRGKRKKPPSRASLSRRTGKPPSI